MSELQLDGIRITYDRTGHGRSIILIHAGCADRRMLQCRAQGLAEQYQIVAYDWRGFGGSGPSTGSYEPHRDLLRIIDALGIEQAAVIGASDGARTAIDAAIVAPQRIFALVLAAPGVSGHTWPSSFMERYVTRVHAVLGVDRLRAYRSGALPVDEDELRRYSEAETEYLVGGPARQRADLGAAVWNLAFAMDLDLNRRSWTEGRGIAEVLEPGAKGRLSEVSVPTLVVAGDEDVPEILALADEVAQGIAGERRTRLPDAGHLPALERPNEFNGQVLAFLSDVGWV